MSEVEDLELFENLMLLSRAAHHVLQEDVVQKLPGSPTLNPARLSILRLLKRREGQSVNDVARFLGQTKAAASQNVDWLARAGLVDRQAVEADRRQLAVSLTESGRALLAEAQTLQLDLLRQAAGRLPPGVLAGWIASARILARSLLEQSGAEAPTCMHCCAYDTARCVLDKDVWRCAYHQAFGTGAQPAEEARARSPGGSS